MSLHHDACTGAPAQPAQDHVPHLHWQTDMSEPFAQPSGCFADSRGSCQPMLSCQSIPVAHHYEPHVHWQSVGPHGCHESFGGSQPMLPANDEQLGGTNVGSPMLPASSCHESFGGGNQCFQPMMLPMLEATTCFLPVVAMIHLGGAPNASCQ